MASISAFKKTGMKYCTAEVYRSIKIYKVYVYIILMCTVAIQSLYCRNGESKAYISVKPCKMCNTTPVIEKKTKELVEYFEC